MTKLNLNGKWRVKNALTGECYAATVPGDIHNDLMRAGIIADPYYSDNANSCGWVTEQDWIYEKKFQVTEEMLKTKIQLVLNGVDTYSEISVNGKVVGETDNMFLRYSFNINDLVKVGNNTLSIRLISIKKKAAELPQDGYFGCFNVPRIFIRKAQCHFSWDWAPNFPAMGIWQDVELELLAGDEIGRVIIRPTLDGKASFFIRMTNDFDIKNVEGKFLRIKVWDKDETVEKTFPLTGRKNAYTLSVENPKLWWPREMGKPNLYNYEVTVVEHGIDTYTKSGRFGFRTVELDETPMDEKSFACRFKINGKQVFLKGANWVPLDIMTGCITDEKYRKAIALAADANYNCLRVWGGGIYEKDIFFDICDELGILAWQDFQFACSDIPDDVSGFAERVVEEAEYQLSRLQCHPSFFVSTGGNEKTGLYGEAKSRGDTLVYYTVRGICQHIDGTRPYLPSSPYSYVDRGNDVSAGDSHVNSYQTARKQQRMHEFRDVLAELESSMSSEIAVQGSCRAEALKKFIPEDKLWPVNDIYDLHFTRNPYDGTGTTFVQQQMEAAEILFGSFDNVNEFVKKSMAMHSEFVKADSEFHRARRGDCGGAMFWMYSDIWPSGTWALLDYYMIPKAAYFASKRSFKPVTPIITKTKDGTALYVVNDTTVTKKGDLKLRYTDAIGNIYHEEVIEISVKPLSSTVIRELDSIIKTGSNRFFTAELVFGAQRVKTFYYHDLWRDIKWQDPELEFEVCPISRNRVNVTITAKSAAARMVNILTPDLADTTLTDNFFDMEKGETRVIEIKCKKPITAEDIQLKHWLQEWDR